MEDFSKIKKKFNIAILHFFFNVFSKKIWHDFLMILVDVLLFKDPDLVFFRIRIWEAEKSRIRNTDGYPRIL